MTDVDRPEQVRSAFVTSGYFRLFGEKAALGRTFTAEEDRPDGGNVVVLSAEFRRRAFGGDFRMIGKEIFLGGKPYQVVGIMAPALELPAAFNPGDARDPIDVWMPFQIDDRSTDANNYFTAAARLKPGISLRGIQAHLQLATSQFRRRFPAAGLRPQAFTAVGMRAALVGDDNSSLSVFSGAVAFLLVIACVNVAVISTLWLRWASLLPIPWAHWAGR